MQTARLNTNRFHATLLDRLRIVSDKSVVTVRTTNFIIHFSPSLKTGQAGKPAHRELHQERRRKGRRGRGRSHDPCLWLPKKLDHE